MKSRGLLITLLAIVAGGMMSCEKEPVCTCTLSTYLMEDWQCSLLGDYDCDIYIIEVDQNACSDALNGIEAGEVIKYKLDCGNGAITIKQ